MFCPECETEYREGFQVCADCQVELVATLDAEPLPGDLAPLIHDGNAGLVGRIVDRLETESIPYVIQAGTALALFDGDVETLDRPREWEGRMWVTASQEERAHEIVETERAASKSYAPPQPLYVAVWRFRPRAGRERAFEEAYGPDGRWAQLFRRDPDYLRTELLRSGDAYLTLDWWRTREAYDAFREEHAREYARIDADTETLTASEESLGGFEAL